MSEPLRPRNSMAIHESNSERNSRVPLRIARPIALRGVAIEKSFRKRNVEVPVLRGVDLEIALGEFTAIVGQSGSGKSTLLHLLGTLDAPDAGEIWYEQQRIDELPARRRDHLRNREFGLIFQFYHLLPELTVLENVLVSQMVQLSVWSYLRRRKENVAETSPESTFRRRDAADGDRSGADVASAGVAGRRAYR
jgi:lipoprotein-releasing system ATP-binding protein